MHSPALSVTISSLLLSLLRHINYFHSMFSEKALKYFKNIQPPPLPEDVEVMNPYADTYKMGLVEIFYSKFYHDIIPRTYIFGINPGRYGGGLTGVSFTDPVALRTYCGIENDLGSKRELSSEFIYRMIEEYGGTDLFFSRCFLTALFPLALINYGKNYNFYDDKNTLKSIIPYLSESVQAQSKFGSVKSKVISLGLKNAGILKLINNELQIFDSIEVLEHPRFIMQYRRKYLKDYIKKYVEALRE
jgi:hypothetical protein